MIIHTIHQLYKDEVDRGIVEMNAWLRIMNVAVSDRSFFYWNVIERYIHGNEKIGAHYALSADHSKFLLVRDGSDLGA